MPALSLTAICSVLRSLFGSVPLLRAVCTAVDNVFAKHGGYPRDICNACCDMYVASGFDTLADAVLVPLGIDVPMCADLACKRVAACHCRGFVIAPAALLHGFLLWCLIEPLASCYSSPTQEAEELREFRCQRRYRSFRKRCSTPRFQPQRQRL